MHSTTDEDIFNVALIIGAASVVPIPFFPGMALLSFMCFCWYSCSHKVCVCIILKIMCITLFFTLFMTNPSCLPFAYSLCAYTLITALCCIADLQACTIAALMPICAKRLTLGFVLMDVPDCLPKGAMPQ